MNIQQLQEKMSWLEEYVSFCNFFSEREVVEAMILDAIDNEEDNQYIYDMFDSQEYRDMFAMNL